MAIKYEFANDVKELANRVNQIGELGLDMTRIQFIRSYNSRSNAIARVIMMPSQWRFILHPQILYVVEVISEKYDILSCEKRVEVIFHELTHIPMGMTGGLRGHNAKEFRHAKRKSLEISKKIC
ncbi:putative metallopeptidase [Stygiolobus caldivivus]|uniref:Metallopeptidase n=1 Tax=Stygiolobus caldivivus TaxID=2824673 RepID=A0A8D5ZH34_9CREN|nr:putative metallopeptidase [Stygiolobus caldivivus]BCU69344.1 metallopeptidase [Stygiolobus caldivivus]